MSLPEAFIQDLRPYLSADELAAFCEALGNSEPSTSIRQNRSKKMTDNLFSDESCSLPIPWSPDGRYLKERPLFTQDPLLHAGAYYVQEAASQFVTHVLRSLLDPEHPVTMLDLCAAPGGKSTAALSVLPTGSLLVSNEIDHRRSRILSENVTKWGASNVIVTGNAPADFTDLTHLFDVILTDVPCSGEGMFRKDAGAVADWSPSKVTGCVELQRSILRDIWPALKPGGLLIYGTCTFNIHEDEEQLQFICEELGAEPLAIPIEKEWLIHKPLTGNIPCYRFMPHYTQGEGLFMAALRKNADEEDLSDRLLSISSKKNRKDTNKGKKGNGREEERKSAKGSNAIDLKKVCQTVTQWVNCEGSVECTPDGILRFIPSGLQSLHNIISSHGLYLLQSGIELGTIKGKDVIPAHALAMNTDRAQNAFPTIELDRETALNYLRRDSILLPDGAPIGYVIVCYDGLPLGFVKNMGNRCNNLYPQEWRIRFS